jgi:UDP-glucose 4-epimerase
MRALDDVPEVASVRGMARSPFDPAAAGWEKTEYRQGDILDRDAVARFIDGADVVVHLAFIIFGDHEETHRVNLEGSRNVFEAVVSASARRLVYTSSVAAYGFHADNPQPLTEDVPARGSEELYYSAQKAELEQVLSQILKGSETDAYVFRPTIVAGRDALAFAEALVRALQLGGRFPFLQRALEELPILAPVLPDPGLPIQLVHHDDVAAALAAAVAGRGSSGAYNLGADGTVTMSDVASELGWYSAPVPKVAVDAVSEAVARIPFLPAQASWVNAGRVPTVVDSAKARRELGWSPVHDTAETMRETIDASRREGLLR